MIILLHVMLQHVDYCSHIVIQHLIVVIIEHQKKVLHLTHDTIASGTIFLVLLSLRTGQTHLVVGRSPIYR